MSKKYYESIPEDQVSALSLAVTSEVLAEFDCMDESMSSRLYGVVETAILHELTKDCIASDLFASACSAYGEYEAINGEIANSLIKERNEARAIAAQMRSHNGYKSNDEAIFPWENTESDHGCSRKS